MTKGMSRRRQRVLPGQLCRRIFKLRQSISLRYWLIPKSNNLKSCLYTISLDGISAGVHSVALVDPGSFLWSCISTTHVCFDLLLLRYASCLSCVLQSIQVDHS
ncbi:hypothetical protein V6N12_018663 [Hibiscus sabdariffa]|uniref:Uncharacterized protein n=1 Tax=Hibiscus sabdariffa TaxID=183260 RepID=A0ABR2BQI3_9ROSI